MKHCKFSVYDCETGRRLRDATAQEIDKYWGTLLRDKPIDGAKLGFSGRTVWIDLKKPTKSVILAWFLDGKVPTPVFNGWDYMANLAERDSSGKWNYVRTVKVEANVAAAFARAVRDGRYTIEGIPGGRFGFPGCRIEVLIPPDEPLLPPDAVIKTWWNETT